MKVRCKSNFVYVLRRNNFSLALNLTLSPHKAVDVDNEKVQVACFSEDHAIEEQANCWTAGWGYQDGYQYAIELHTISVDRKFHCGT